MNTITRLAKLERLANKITEQTQQRLKADGLGCETNLNNAIASVKPGNKYTKIDVGSSGKYIIDADGNIFGIKAYGVIHRGHHYGNLDTIDAYFWGNFTAHKI
jgi:hypothetical protein